MMYVTKLCVKNGVWQSCVWKMVCNKAVCETWCVAKEHFAGPQDAVQRHQSMSLTVVTAQKEKFVAGKENGKLPQNMSWVQARHWHAASLRTFLLPAFQCHICLASDFFPRWVKIDTHRFTAGLGDRGLVMCRVPRCRAETSKHATYSRAQNEKFIAG